MLYMNINLKRTVEVLNDLDKKAKELEEVLKGIRDDIHKALWDLIEIKRMELKRNVSSIKNHKR